MSQWLPPLAIHRFVLAAVHAGLSPWTPAVPFLADRPVSGGDVLGAAAQQVLGYGVTGAVALVLAWIVWKGSFVPQKRVDEMIAAKPRGPAPRDRASRRREGEGRGPASREPLVRPR
jgi:hypothetical protein